jgi:hypothetical protein
MRPFVTWLIVGALVVVGLFAARDALRDEPTSKAAPTPTETPSPGSELFASIPDRGELATELRDLGARGALWVLDAECRRSVLQLPDLVWSARGTVPVTDCHGPAPVVDERFGLTASQVEPDTISVATEGWGFTFRGTAPAFKPGGTLTFVRDGRLYEWTVRCPLGKDAVRFEGLHSLTRCERPVAGAPRGVKEVVWLGEREYAAVVGENPTAQLVVVRGSRSERIFQSVGNRLGGLEASPGGHYVAARMDGFLALFRTDRPGTTGLPPGAVRGLSVAWSPDDRFAALATLSFVYVFRTELPGDFVRLELPASGLRWP